MAEATCKKMTEQQIRRLKAKRYGSFRMAVEDLINANSMENGSDTPDYVLAEFLVACLKAFDAAILLRDKSRQ